MRRKLENVNTNLEYSLGIYLDTSRQFSRKRNASFGYKKVAP